MPKPRPEASGLAEIVAKAEQRFGVEPLLMPTAAAKAIGISKMTLTRWRRDHRLDPWAEIKRGNQWPIPLYGPEEIEIGQAMRGKIPPGPQPGGKPITQRTQSPKRKTRIINADSKTYRPAKRHNGAARNGLQKPV